jgi:hypothetical protein
MAGWSLEDMATLRDVKRDSGQLPVISCQPVTATD